MRTFPMLCWLLAATLTTPSPVRAGDRHDPAPAGLAGPALSNGDPLPVDLLSQQAYVKASNTGVDDRFGWSMAASGDTVVVGAPFEDSNASGVNGDQANNSAGNAGAAYVFVKTGAGWVQQAYLKASNAGTGDNFGQSVAISGDTLVVGAHLEDSDATGVNGSGSNNNASGSGAAYVFVRNGGGWSQQAYLKASNTSGGVKPDQFGWSVAVSGDTIVVGAYLEDSSATGVDGDQLDDGAFDSGAAYVFVRNAGIWSQQAYLKASNTGSADTFGASVAISGDTIVVGAASELAGEDSFGSGVSGDGLGNAISNSGAAYVFVRQAGAWSQQAFLKAVNPMTGAEFGRSVAISGDRIVVGAIKENSGATGVDGDPFNNGAPNSGSAYEFVRSGGSWSVGAYLKASNTGAGDFFGASIALSGDTLLVGAIRERSSATGIDGDGTNNDLSRAGAAYAFTRVGGTWSQLAYLKASNTGASDEFGNAVALSGDVAVVGAWLEDSSATGANGNQADDSALQSGAVYAYDLDQFPEPWVDVGLGLAGLTGVPQLTGTGTLVGGEAVGLVLTNAKPNSSAAVVIGFSRIDAHVKGGTLVPFPNAIVYGLPTDGNGALVIASVWPTGVPSGSQFWVQEWITDAAALQGVSASNGLAATTP